MEPLSAVISTLSLLSSSSLGTAKANRVLSGLVRATTGVKRSESGVSIPSIDIPDRFKSPVMVVMETSLTSTVWSLLSANSVVTISPADDSGRISTPGWIGSVGLLEGGWVVPFGLLDRG